MQFVNDFWAFVSENWDELFQGFQNTLKVSAVAIVGAFVIGLVLGAAHPQGPLALADLIGLDTTKAVAESLYEEFKEPLYAAPPLLNRMVDAGLLGRKTGRGFYTY